MQRQDILLPRNVWLSLAQIEQWRIFIALHQDDLEFFRYLPNLSQFLRNENRIRAPPLPNYLQAYYTAQRRFPRSPLESITFLIRDTYNTLKYTLSSCCCCEATRTPREAGSFQNTVFFVTWCVPCNLRATVVLNFESSGTVTDFRFKINCVLFTTPLSPNNPPTHQIAQLFRLPRLTGLARQ